MNKPKEATHYSPSRDEYYHWDNGLFVWADGWIECLDKIDDIMEI